MVTDACDGPSVLWHPEFHPCYLSIPLSLVRPHVIRVPYINDIKHSSLKKSREAFCCFSVTWISCFSKTHFCVGARLDPTCLRHQTIAE